MTTFDVDEVSDFTAGLAAQMDRCDNGEGLECSTLEDGLRRYASLCCEFREGVREWGRAVFTGRVAYAPEVELAWLTGGTGLLKRAYEMWQDSANPRVECYIVEGRTRLKAALWDLHRLLDNWVSPRLAVGPSGRRVRVKRATIDEVRTLLASLPPLPADWKPYDVSQQARYRRLKKS